jgi:hypothetical protein
VADVSLVFDLLARDNASKSLEGVAGSIGKVAGVLGAGAALFDSFWEAVGNEKAVDKLSAQLGLATKASESAGKVAGQVYRDAYGESMDDVTEAIGTVISSIDGMRTASEADLKSVTETAMDFAGAFDTDVSESVNTVGQLIRNGLVQDATQGFDLMTAAYQKVPAAMRDELPDILDEYGVTFHNLGFAGEDAFGLLVDAAGGGAIALDKTGDALKEFTIRATDMSSSTTGVYETLGLDAETMANRVLAGGEQAQGALADIATGLLGIEDPSARANAAIALFGTPLEDLGTAGIPKFLESLTATESGLGDVEGAAGRMGEVLNDNFATRLEGWKRSAQGFVQDALMDLSDGFSDGQVDAEGFSGGLQAVGAGLADVAEFGGAVVDIAETVGGFFFDLPGPVQAGAAALGIFVALKGPVAGALETIALKAFYMRDGIVASTTSMAGARSAGAGFIGLLGGPWGLAIAGATVGLGFLISGLNDSDDSALDAETAQRSFADAVRDANGAIDENVRQAAAKAAQDAGLLDIAESLGISLPTVTDAVLGQRGALDEAVGAANAYFDASLRAENSGDLKMTENAEKVHVFVDGLNTLAPTVETTRQQQEALATATEQSGTALDNTTPKADDFAKAMEGVQTEVSDAKKEVDNYKLSLDILTGTNVSLIEVQAAYFDSLNLNTESLKGLDGAVADANGQLNLQTEAGRFASDTLLGVRDSGNQLISTMVQQGKTSDEVRAQDAQLRDSFIETAKKMGFSAEQAGGLADSILGIPDQRTTKIDADVAQASGAIAGLQKQIDAVAQNRSASINFRATLPDLNGIASGSGRPGLAFGGEVPGFSPDDRADNVPIMATAGEFMQPRPAVRRYGKRFMESVRNGLFPLELARGYAFGGEITLTGSADTADASAGIGKVNDDFLAAANSAARKNMEPGIGMVAALQWARSQVGKPYLWGSAGPTGFDCSGFMSAITNVIRGRSANSRLGSTASFPWAGFAGGDGLFTIGSTKNAGGGIGHMAGTLLGVNVESRGGQGVVVGGSARGAHDRLFGTRAHLATYDSGGTLQPGYTLAYNGTGKGETIRTAEQEAALRAGGGSFEGNLYLDSGEFLGIVRGEMREQRVEQRRGSLAAAAAAGILR